MNMPPKESSKESRRGRPPKIESNDHNTKEKLIRSGLEYLTQYGFIASGLDKILSNVGVPKGSFYYYFSSKEAFGIAVIQQYSIYFEKKLDFWLSDTNYPPLKRIENFVDDAKLGIERYEFSRGCLIGNLEQEIELLPEHFRPLLAEIYNNWQSHVAKCLKEAQTQKSISAKVNCDQLAEFFWLGWEGAVSRTRLLKNSKPLDNYFKSYLAALTK